MAQLTLTQKSDLADNSTFRSRIFQGLFSKANYWASQINPTSLRDQKAIAYALPFLKGGANSIDIYATVRFWLSNYNVDPPVLIEAPDSPEGQPTDDAILNTLALDTVYFALAGAILGDDVLSPI